jgi:hypothetical protein
MEVVCLHLPYSANKLCYHTNRVASCQYECSELLLDNGKLLWISTVITKGHFLYLNAHSPPRFEEGYVINKTIEVE